MSSLAAAEKLGPQWAAAFGYFLLKVADIPAAQITAKIPTAVSSCMNSNLKKDFLAVLPKIESMNAEDCRLFYESFQNILKELATPATFEQIVNSLLISLYDTLGICLDVLEDSASYKHQRTPTQPEFTYPPVFYEHLENSFKFIYNILSNQNAKSMPNIKSVIQTILYDFIIQDPKNFKGKRYEGKIFLALSDDPSWFSKIFTQIISLLNDIKQKEVKNVAICFLQNVKKLKNARMDQMQLLVTMLPKLPDEVVNELVCFIGSTLVLSTNVPNVGALISTVSKPSPTKKFEYRYMKALIRLFSIDDSKSRVEKFQKLIRSFQKSGFAGIEKLCKLAAELMCPKKFPVDQFLKEMVNLFFKIKGKQTLISSKTNIDSLVEVFHAAAVRDVGAVANFLKPFFQSFQQLKDQIATLQFVFKVFAKIQSIDAQCSSQIVAVIAPSLQSIISSKADKALTESALLCIPSFWKYIPNSRENMVRLLSDALTTDDLNVELATMKGYTQLMKETTLSQLPMDLTTTIPTYVANLFDHIVEPALLINVTAQLSEYFETILSFKDYKPIKDIDKVLLAIDTALFPYLFYSDQAIHLAIHRLYRVLAKLTSTNFLGTFFLEHKGTSLLSCFSTNEEWFINIYSKAALLWVKMDRFANREFTNQFLKGLFVIARPELKGKKIDITSTFFNVALEYIYKWNKDLITSYLHLLHISIWPAFFTEYDKIYTKYNGQPWKNFLYIQNAFISNRFFSKYNGSTKAFDETLKNYIDQPRSKFEKDIPYEILTLNVISSYIRKQPAALNQPSKANPNLILKLLEKINLKELFVINEPLIFAFLDFISAFVSTLKLKPEHVKNVIDFIINISEIAQDTLTLQYACNECLYSTFKMNQDSRSLIFQAALSSRQSSKIGWAILQSGMQLTPLELTQLFVLAMSIFQSDPSFGIYVAKLLVKDKTQLLINPLSQYDIETEGKIWKTVEQNLSDEQILVYTQLLAASVKWVRKKQKVSMFFTPLLEQNASVEDFPTIFSVISSCNEDPSVLLPFQTTLFKIFSENPNQIDQMFDLMFENDNNHEAAAFVSQIAFRACPEPVTKYLLNKLECFNVGTTDELWTVMKQYNRRIPISCLSLILALIDNSLQYFKGILAQLVLYSLYSYNEQKAMNSQRVPPLLLSLMHQMNPSIESFSGFFINASNSKRLYTMLQQYSPEECDKFETFLIPNDLPMHCYNFIKEIAPLISPKKAKPLINLIISYAIEDNVNSFLTFAPIVIGRLNDICDPEGTLTFLNFIFSFIYDNNDPRLIQAIFLSLPRLIENKCSVPQIDENIVLSTALSVLPSIESLQDPIYHQLSSFVKSISQIAGNNNLSATYEILYNLWALSGFKLIKEIGNIQDLVQFTNKLIGANGKKDISAFLLRFACSNVIQDLDFRVNLTSFIVDFFGQDLNILKDIKDAEFFLLLSAISNENTVSSSYAKLLAYFYSITSNPPSCDLIGLFGQTYTFLDVDTNFEMRMISPADYEIPPPESVPKSLDFYQEYFRSH